MQNYRTEDEQRASDQHEDILAGLANERPHSRLAILSGNPYQGFTRRPVKWTYDGRGGMVKLSGMSSQPFI